MRKFYSLLLMLLVSVGAWAQEQAQLNIQVSTDANKHYYAIKNLRGNVYAAYSGASQSIALYPGITSKANLFYFKAGAAEGTYKIYSALSNKACNATNSWNDEGIDWYIQPSGNTTHTGFAISKANNLTSTDHSWNNDRGEHKRVGYWDGNDVGSVWAFEEVTDISTASITFSNDTEKTLYNIRNLRVDKYANYEYAGTQFTEIGSPAIGSYFYFVEDESATNVPEGYVACRVYSALNQLPVENPNTGNMTSDGKLYYLGIHENASCGYVLRAASDDNSSWNDANGTNVTTYGFNDAGSIWAMCATNKTMSQVEEEMVSYINNTVTEINDAAIASYFSYPSEAIQTALNAVSDIKTFTYAQKCDAYTKVKAAHKTMTSATKGTEAPAVGSIIRLKNRNYGSFLTHTGTSLEGTTNYIGNQNTLWKVVAGDGTNVKLQNVATSKYIGEIRNSANVAMVEEASAKMFAITNQTACYGVIKETTGGGYAYAHINGSNKLVGWEPGANASQWILQIYSAKDDLIDLLSQTNAKFGTSIGLYATTDELTDAVKAGQRVVDNESASDQEINDAIANIVANTPANLVLNKPQTGKFYRLQNAKSGKWLSGSYSTITAETDKDELATVFYVGENNELLSYKGGRYYDCNNKLYTNIGESKAGTFELAVGGPSAGIITYKNNGYYVYGAKADSNLDRGSGTGTDTGYNWEITEVTWLPVPMKVVEDKGYATLYAPVALKNSGRVEAYVGTQNGNVFSMNRVDDEEDGIIPANTPVILKYLGGIGGSTGTVPCVLLEISNSTITSDLPNSLEGTFADTKIKGDAYVLAKPTDSTFGLYLAKKNARTDVENDSWINNGFRAYLPADNLNARFLTFNFDDNAETGISAVEIEEAAPANAAIYDLSGRRVQSAKSGLYIINGKKVIK